MRIDTERLTIREFKPEDEAALIEMASDGSLNDVFGDCTNCAGWMGRWLCEARALTDAELPAPAERTPAVPMPVLRWDSERRAVQCGDAEVLLTPREADVFAALYAAMPGAVRREDLLREFARTAGNGADVYISYLRKKLAALPTAIRIHSERGSGYTLLIPSAEGGNTERGSGETR